MPATSVFPGGRPHPGDRNAVDTALREAEEEVGIPPENVTVLGFLAADPHRRSSVSSWSPWLAGSPRFRS